MTPTFLPDRLRPLPVRRRRRRLLVPVLAVAPLALLGVWRIDDVEVHPCPGVPGPVLDALAELRGEAAWAVDLEDVRRRLEVWPAVAGVEVRLELPHRLHVRLRPQRIAGSARVGGGWHGVTVEGAWAGPLSSPEPPIVAGRVAAADDRRRALAAARRLESAVGREVESVRAVTPSDFEVRFASTLEDAGVLVVRVAPQPTEGERWWCAQVVDGQPPARWADLRWDDRVVVGGPA